jgi:hypothetical protein
MVKALIQHRWFWFWFALTGAALVILLVAFLKKLLALPPLIVAVQKRLMQLFGESMEI